MESLFWKAIVNIANGKDAPMEIFQAVNQSLDALETFSDDQICADWFDIRPISPPQPQVIEDETSHSTAMDVTPDNSTTDQQPNADVSPPDHPETGTSQSAGTKRARSSTGADASGSQADNNKKPKTSEVDAAPRRSTRVVVNLIKESEEKAKKSETTATTPANNTLPNDGAKRNKSVKKSAPQVRGKVEPSKIQVVSHIELDPSYGTRFDVSLRLLVCQKCAYYFERTNHVMADISRNNRHHSLQCAKEGLGEISDPCRKVYSECHIPNQYGTVTDGILQYPGDHSFYNNIEACNQTVMESGRKIPLYMSQDETIRNKSTVRLVTKDEFASWSPTQVQREFSQRNIFIPATDDDVNNQPAWGVSAVEDLADLDRQFQAQSKMILFTLQS